MKKNYAHRSSNNEYYFLHDAEICALCCFAKIENDIAISLQRRSRGECDYFHAMGIPSRYFSIVIIEDIFLHRFLLDSREGHLLSDSVGFYCFGNGKNSYLKLTLLYVGALAPCCQVVDGWVASGGGLRDKRGYF